MPKKPNILLIEDDPELCEGWCDLFTFLEFDYRAFNRGLKALSDQPAIASANLLITDYYLPDINGVEVVKKIRETRPDMKVIVLTGSRESSVLTSVQQIDNCELLHKPLNIETLEESIQRCMA